LDFNEEVIAEIENLVYMANIYKMHVNLNLHRVPGFCINSGFNEPYNLWKDEQAQQPLFTHWEMWAKRFNIVSEKMLSFDLINESCFREDRMTSSAGKLLFPVTFTERLLWVASIGKCLRCLRNISHTTAHFSTDNSLTAGLNC